MPLAAVVAGLVWIGAGTQVDQSVDRVGEVADGVAARIEGRIDLYAELVTSAAAFGVDPDLDPPPERTLRILLATDRDVLDAAAVDARGREVARVARGRVVGPDDLRDRAEDPAVVATLAGAARYVALVEPTGVGRVGELVVAAPVVDPISRRPVGAIVVQVSSDVLADAVVGARTDDPSVDPFVAAPSGEVLVHDRLAVVLGGRRVADAAESGLRRGLGGGWVVRGVTPLELEGGAVLVVVEEPALTALAPSVQSVGFAAVVLVVGVLLAVGLRRRLVSSVVRPTEELARMAERLRAGELDARAPEVRIEELAVLAERLDAMAGELERVVARLRRSNRDLEQFATAAAHDLRGPLHTVSAYVDVLRRRYAGTAPSGDDDVERHWGYVVDAVRTLDSLLTGLLAYSMVDHEGPPPDAAVDLDAVLDAVLTALAGDLHRSGARVERDGTLPVLAGDAVQLYQLLQNLVANALAHGGGTAGGADVTVGAAPARLADGRPAWEIRVVDRGPGIDPRHHAEVFELFGRIPGRPAGAGVGLALCARIAERHGGTIAVRSRPGEGATFLVTLPAAADRDADRTRPADAVP